MEFAQLINWSIFTIKIVSPGRGFNQGEWLHYQFNELTLNTGHDDFI